MSQSDKPSLHEEIERIIGSFSQGQPGYATFLPLLNRCSQIIKGFEERIATGELSVRSSTRQTDAVLLDDLQNAYLEADSKFYRELLGRAANALLANQSATQSPTQALLDACELLLDYRRRNTINFQLEKADTYMNRISVALDDIKSAQPEIGVKR